MNVNYGEKYFEIEWKLLLDGFVKREIEIESSVIV